MTFSLPAGTGELLKINRQKIFRFLLKIRFLQSRPIFWPPNDLNFRKSTFTIVYETLEES